ncbi:L-lactate transporter [subsurface metagenome]
MMSGIVKAGTGTGQLIMPLVASWLISGYGWRNSFIILGIASMGVIVSIGQFLRRDPSQKGLKPYGDYEGSVSSLDLERVGLSLQEAIHTKQFWAICAAYFIIWYCAQTIMVHLAPHAVDLGVSVAHAASTISTFGGTSILGRLIMGGTGDRVGNRKALVICFIVLITALGWLQLAKELSALYLFAVIYGFAHGGFFALISPLVAELLGRRSHGSILGAILSIAHIGGAVGPVVTGRIFDVTSSYQLAFLILIAISIAGIILCALLRPIRVQKYR